MDSLAIDIFCSSSIFESQSSSLQIHEGKSLDAVDFQNNNKFSAYCNHKIPKPPPLPRKNLSGKLSKYCCVPKETKDVWEKLFKEGYGADVHVVSEDGKIIAAHYSILSVASPVLGNFLQQSKLKNGTRYLTIPGVPYDAICAFICFLYSSCYEEEEMKKFVLHLLVLSHCYVVPPLKRACEQFLESGWLTKENVIDVLQLARTCDAPRLSLVCLHMVVRDFKPISSTEAWKVMKRANPCLEQELLEFVVEADSRKEEREKKIEEKKVYLQLHEAMEALVHICQEGCRNIGPCSKVLNKNQGACAFQACKGLETLIRHFSGCETRVPGGCVHCKRMWQLLELHSRICSEPENCKVPLCGHFKVKMQQQSKKDNVKWEILVYKVMAARNAQKLFSSLRSSF